MKGMNLTSAAARDQSGFLRWCRRSSFWLVPLMIGVLYFVYGFSQLSQYGVTWDEPLHRNWGKLFVYFWKTGNRQALELMPGHGIHYGSLYYTLNYLLSEQLYQSGFFRFVEANHILNLLTASVATGFTFIIGRMMGGIRTGVIAALAFIFFPQLLAHAQYNPKDIPLMTAVLITATVFIVAMKRGSVFLFLLSAFLMGASVAAKVSALLMAPVFAATYVVWVVSDSRAMHLRSVKIQLVTLLCALGCFCTGAFLFWPDAWGDPLLILRSVRFFLGTDFWPGKVLFFGTEYAGADLPWYYTPFEFFAATPLLVFAGFLAGTVLLIRQFRSYGQKPEYILLLLWVFFPLLFSMKPGLVRYDGIRQFFFLIPAASVIAAYGIGAASDFLKPRLRGALSLALALVILVADLAYEVALVHPYEGSYRSEAVRSLYPSGMDHVFQVEYWGATYRQGMQWLIQHAEANPVICVPTAGILVEWYPWREDFTFDCSKDTNYVMFFTRYSEAGEFAKLTEPVFRIDRMGARLLNIYKVK